jgi:hypothetical protein
MCKFASENKWNFICMVHPLLLQPQVLAPTVIEVSFMHSLLGIVLLQQLQKLRMAVEDNETYLITVGKQFLERRVSQYSLIVVSWPHTSLLYNSSSLVSVAYSALGDSTMASTGQLSWQKPQ